MTNPLLPTFSGPLGNALTSSTAFVDLLETRDPTPFDSGYPVQKKWLNTVTNNLWYLKNFSSTTGQVLANWILISSSIVAIEKLQGNTGGAVSPDGSNIIHTVGDGIGITVAGNPGTNTLTWSLVGGGNAIEKFVVDAFTAPGTNPVAPTNLGLVTVTGGQIAAGTTGNVIQTNSLAANTYTIQVQRSQAVAVSTIADNGVSHFNSAHFTVNASAFVSLVHPAPASAINQVKVQTFTSTGTYTPTSGMVYCQVLLVGGGGGGAGVAAAAGVNIAVSQPGSGASYSYGLFTAAMIGGSQSVTIGAGGAGGAAGANAGTAGTQSSFGGGPLMTAPGGNAGTGTISGGPTNEFTDTPPNSAGTGGYLNLTGNPGLGGFGTNQIAGGGQGGGSVFGGGGTGGRSPGAAINATNFGAGGGGAQSNSGDVAKAGGNGAGGICIVTEYISS